MLLEQTWRVSEKEGTADEGRLSLLLNVVKSAWGDTCSCGPNRQAGPFQGGSPTGHAHLHLPRLPTCLPGQLLVWRHHPSRYRPLQLTSVQRKRALPHPALSPPPPPASPAFLPSLQFDNGKVVAAHPCMILFLLQPPVPSSQRRMECIKQRIMTLVTSSPADIRSWRASKRAATSAAMTNARPWNGYLI